MQLLSNRPRPIPLPDPEGEPIPISDEEMAGIERSQQIHLSPDLVRKAAGEAKWNAQMLTIKEFRKYAHDMAVLTSHGRRVGGVGDLKVIAEMPPLDAMMLWYTHPEIQLDKEAFHKWLAKEAAEGRDYRIK